MLKEESIHLFKIDTVKFGMKFVYFVKWGILHKNTVSVKRIIFLI